MACDPSRLKAAVIFATPFESSPEAPRTFPLSETCTVPVGVRPLSSLTATAIVTGAPNIAEAGTAHVVAVGESAQAGKLRRIANRPNREKSENRITANSYADELLRRMGATKKMLSQTAV